jgi:L-asparaginase
MEKYENGLVLKKAGIVSGLDMTTETAITKLMFLLGQTLSYQEVKVKMQEPLAGELNRV